MNKVSNQPCFGSRLPVTDSLKMVYSGVLSHACPKSTRQKVAYTVNALMKDGKNDVIALVEKQNGYKSSAAVFVNGKKAEEKVSYGMMTASYLHRVNELLYALAHYADKVKTKNYNFNKVLHGELRTSDDRIHKIIINHLRSEGINGSIG